MLEWLAKWMRDMYGLNVKVEAAGPSELLSENITFFLFRTVRELVFNVVKYAGVKAARIQAGQVDDLIRAIVEDEGAGFDPNVVGPTGEILASGLLRIRERLAVLGGRMEVDSAPGQGSRFRLLIPIEDR